MLLQLVLVLVCIVLLYTRHNLNFPIVTFVCGIRTVTLVFYSTIEYSASAQHCLFESGLKTRLRQLKFYANCFSYAGSAFCRNEQLFSDNHKLVN